MGCLILKDTSISNCEVERRKPVHSFLENLWLRFFITDLPRLSYRHKFMSCIFTSVVYIMQPGFYKATLL